MTDTDTDTIRGTRTRSAIPARAATPLLVAGGLALALAQGVLPIVPSDAAGAVRAVAGHRSAEVISAVAFIAAAVCLAWGLLSVASLTFDKGRRFVRVGLAVSAVGTFWLIAGRACFNLYEVALVSNQDLTTAVAVTRDVGQSTATAVLLPTLLAFLIGPILLGVGLWRAGVAPWWPALAWLVGVVIVDATDTTVRFVPALGMLVLTVALAAWGRAVSRRDS